jgi:hypothetical protein
MRPPWGFQAPIVIVDPTRSDSLGHTKNRHIRTVDFTRAMFAEFIAMNVDTPKADDAHAPADKPADFAPSDNLSRPSSRSTRLGRGLDSAEQDNKMDHNASKLYFHLSMRITTYAWGAQIGT